MEKLVTVLLIILCLCCVLTSCKDNIPDTPQSSDTGADSNTPGSETDNPESSILFAENGQVNYTLIRPELVNDAFKSALTAFFADIQAKTGSVATYKDDWINPLEDYDEDAPEILVGYTNRPESLEVLQNTPADSYTVKRVNNKIVIAAHSLENYAKAFEVFLKDGIKSVENSAFAFEGEFKGEGNAALLFDTVDAFSEYRIVYRGEDNKTLAKQLATKIKKAYGVEIEYTDDSVAPQDKEIVLGLTNRVITDVDVSNGEYKIIAKGAKLYIIASKNSILNAACDAFMSNFMQEGCSYSPSVIKELNETFNLYTGGDSASFADGTDIRIMSWNILFQVGSGSPIPGRDDRVCATILTFQPDVIGIQEATPAWYTELEAGIGLQYGFVYQKNTRGGNNYSGIAYNKETVKVVKQDMLFFSSGNSDKMRVACWAMFERLADGKQFIVVNTHWDPGDAGSVRLVQAKEEAALINQLVATHKVPVFATGDFNCKEDSEPFTVFMNTTGMQDSKYDSKVINRQTTTYHTLNQPVPNSKLSIDHITATNDVELLYYNTLIDDFVIKASDHCPIYVDVKFK
ncbi:MAG: endonuclease/exonuclease/phosphatase family protein [Clostridia bacterium]|nr:endonuclease/exonuclease/phosphatase family protein [Clostridia bacterium]